MALRTRALLLVAVLLLCRAACAQEEAAPDAQEEAAPAAPAADTVTSIKGTVQQMWSWWPKGGKALPPGATDAFKCLADAFSSAPQDKKVYSQWGEDGILEAIYNCITPQSKYYVEFGTESCSECTTRYLRDKGWTGLLMDGGHANPAINLHTEYMRSDNIVDLLKKYKVPFPKFDHLTTDLDLNTQWLTRAIVAAGFRPRTIIAEYNRNFKPDQSFATIDMPTETWSGSCYYDASGLAYERLLRPHNYSLIAFDQAGVNLFFVDNSELGVPVPHSFADVEANPDLEGWKPLHGDCMQNTWLYVPDSPDLADEKHWMRPMHPVMLNHKREGPWTRMFYEAASPYFAAALKHRRRYRAGGPHDFPERR